MRRRNRGRQRAALTQCSLEMPGMMMMVVVGIATAVVAVVGSGGVL
jgi:hypothetical protein